MYLLGQRILAVDMDRPPVRDTLHTPQGLFTFPCHACGQRSSSIPKRTTARTPTQILFSVPPERVKCANTSDFWRGAPWLKDGQSFALRVVLHATPSTSCLSLSTSHTMVGINGSFEESQLLFRRLPSNEQCGP
jgi:hypothetical protein